MAPGAQKFPVFVLDIVGRVRDIVNQPTFAIEVSSSWSPEMSLLEIILRWLHIVVDSESPGRTIWRTVVGAAIGGLLGIVVPLFLAWLMVLGGHDKTGAGGIAMLTIGTLPAGLIFGGSIGARWNNP